MVVVSVGHSLWGLSQDLGVVDVGVSMHGVGKRGVSMKNTFWKTVIKQIYYPGEIKDKTPKLLNPFRQGFRNFIYLCGGVLRTQIYMKASRDILIPPGIYYDHFIVLGGDILSSREKMDKVVKIEQNKGAFVRR